ncbi:MAG: hypothetical protein IPQ25_17025 [Chitinophagaceae bacterium]|nr:hypothetical protein [Chitinophagaceae bacterium]
MSAIGARFDLVGPHALVRGLPWSLNFTRLAGAQKTPVDLTGCSARLVITGLLETADPPEPLEFTTTGGNIVLGGALGTVAIDLDETDTADVPDRALYRFYLTDALDKETLLLRGRLGVIMEDA